MILLIQVNYLIRHDTAEMLRRAGHHVEQAGCASEAFGLLRNHKFDLVITEVLPTIDGVDLATKIRQRRPELPIIRTGYMPPVGADATLKEPAGFVFQSVDAKELLAMVHRMLG